jgi:hypothetical protein
MFVIGVSMPCVPLQKVRSDVTTWQTSKSGSGMMESRSYITGSH